MSKILFTSESVTEGHPDKVCDRISDAVLDEVMKHDPNGRVACETCCTTGMVLVMGEISTEHYIDFAGIARGVLKDIGYDSPKAGFDGNTCAVMVAIDEQSPDIAMGTNDGVGGAGDQGMMFGYACNETPDLMPLPITLANKMAYLLMKKRKDGTIPHILPDGKTQVTVEYDEGGNPVRVDTVVISTQHEECVAPEDLEEPLKEHVIKPVLDELLAYQPDMDVGTYNLFVNPTGRFVKGGPAADSGLTGRKIIVDTYGGYARHGGGSFSGKDPTKVDLSYAIGVPQPVSIRVDTYGTGKYAENKICDAIEAVYDLTPRGIINWLDLRKPVYKSTSAYGHFGNVIGEERTWEKTDTAEKLLDAIK